MSVLRSAIAGGVRNPVLANLLMVCILLGGWFASQRMVREAFPEFELDHIAVEVAYPGASPEDVEKAICTPVEEALRGVDGVQKISSSANENHGSVWVRLLSNVKDPDAVLKDVKDRVDQIRDWPTVAEKPIVRETTLRTDVINVAVYGEVPERTLKQFAREVEQDLAVFPEISQISLAGVRDEEIIIEISEEALAAYHLTVDKVMAVVARSSLDLPAGVVRTSDEEVTLRVTGQRYRAADYESLVLVEHGDAIVRLGEIARVHEGFEDATVRGRFHGMPGVVVQVFKTPDEDSIKIAKTVRDYVERRQADLPERVRMSVWGDNSVEIQSRISMLVSNGLQGLAVLFLTLWLFLEFRLAFWVAAGIPISFAASLLFMDYFDQTINVVSLFALIMVSGIIVDDSIVIAESVHTRRQLGDEPALAAIEGTYRVALPVLGSTMTTIVAFIPLMFVVGVMGKFIYVLPIVVIGALIGSTIEGLWIQPAHLCHGEKPGSAYVAKPPNRMRLAIDRGFDYVVTRWYRPVYHAALNNPLMTLGVTVAVLVVTAGLWFGGRVPFVVLPKEDGRVLRARVRYPEGTPVSVSERTIERLEAAAWALNADEALKPYRPGPLVREVFSITGEFADFLSLRGSNLCEVRVELMPSGERRIGDDRIIERWRHHIGTLHDATEFAIVRQQIGPTEQPIEIRLLGQDLDDLKAASERIQTRLKEFAGVSEIRDDLIPGKRQLNIELRPAARALGLTLDDVARQVRHGFFGGEAVRLYRDKDQIKVRVRLPEKERASIVDLETLRIKTPRGDEVPFLEVADIRWSRGYAYVMHQDGQRRVRVLADVDERTANADRIIKTLQAGFLNEVVADHDGMSYEFGGERERMNESLGSLFDGFALAMIVNYAFLCAVLRSYVKPMVIIAAIPFGLVGVIWGHLALGYDVTMMSLFGIVGVSGLVVNESLVLVDSINWLIREGKSVREAVYVVGEQRFRPILLTSITDLAGLLPLLLNSGGQAQAVQPMAISLSFGLLAAAFLNLLVVPVVYLVINDLRRAAYWLKNGGSYPVRELVEEEARERLAVPALGTT